MQITHQKTNHVSQPMGFWMEKPVLSWVTESEVSKKQVSAQIRIATDEAMEQIVFDSGLGDWDSRAYRPDFTPEPRTRYYWQVTVTGEAGDCTSGTDWFETGKQSEPWQAEWIRPNETPERHPLLRRGFESRGELVRARVYATGLGAYYLFVNGQRVAEEYLAPGCNAYDQWIQVQTYDVTALVQPGDNVIGAMLGNSWAKGRFGLSNEGRPLYAREFTLLCELHLEYADGSESVICSDEAWSWAEGPVRESSIYDGEVYDANQLPAGWAEATFDASGWKPVLPWENTLGQLHDRLSLPVTVNQTFRPAAVLHTPAGETVIDLGQNIVGWLRLKIRAPKGTEISLWHGETLQNDCFYNDNLRSAKAEYHYLSDGEEAEVEPWFTFYGFRYVKVEGWPGEINLDDVTACCVYSQLEETGHLETSHPLVNRLIENALWSQRDNFLDVPTDCPQRDEREGWTGDAQVFSGTALYNMDCAAFYLKYGYDMYMEQLKNHGCVPHVVPDVNTLHDAGSAQAQTGACAWSDAATVIPWTTYVYTGDRDVLERQLDSMRAWVDFVTDFGLDVATGGGWLSTFHYGDWLALDGDGGPDGVMGGTEIAFLAAAYYVYSAELTAKAAEALGRTELAADYQARADKIRADLRHEYFTAGGRGALQTQTFYVVSLFMHICPDNAREKIAQALVARLKSDKMHLKTGFIGTPLLCRVLSEAGYSQYAYQLLLNEDLPSWLYEVKMGATTIWERWNSINPDGSISSTGMNSLNHYSYGSVVEWMYRHMCGLKPYEPGFKRVSLRPEVDKRLGYAKMSYRSAMGLYRSEWRIDEAGQLHFVFEIPFNATAEVCLPNARVEDLVGAEGLGFVPDGSGVRATLPAGVYAISYQPSRSYLNGRYNLDTPIAELMANEQTAEILHRMIPAMAHRDVGGFVAKASIRQLLDNPFAAMRMTDIDFDAVEDALSAVK